MTIWQPDIWRKLRPRRPLDYQDCCNFSGQGNLLSKLTINGTTVDAATSGFIYQASYATGASGSMSLAERHGQAAGALSEAGGGTLGSLADALPGVGGGSDQAIPADGTGYLEVAGTSFGDVPTSDMVVLAVVDLTTTPTQHNTMISKRGADPYPGWHLIIENTTNEPSFSIDPGTDPCATADAPEAAIPGCYVIVGCVNRDEASANGMFCFSNAAPGTGVDGSVATITNTGKLTLLAHSAATGLGRELESGNSLILAAMWHQANWFSAGATGAAEMQAVASELTARILGTYANLSRYGNAYPTITRSTTSTIRRRHGSADKIHTLGAGAAALEDPGGVAGQRVDGAATNLCLRNCEMDIDGSGSPWTHSSATVTGNVAGGPSASGEYCTISEDATPGTTHYAKQAITIGNTTKYCAQAKLKKTNRDWVRLNVYDGSANFGVYFDLNTGAKGSDLGSPDDSGIEDLGDGWYLCWVVFTSTNTAGVLYLVACEANEDYTFDGASQASFHATDVQLETGDGPTSAIQTAGAAVTRNANNIRRDSDVATPANDHGQGTIVCEFTLPALTNPSVDRYVWALSDGGAAADSIQLWVDASAKKMTLSSAASGGNAGSCVPNLNPYSGNKIRCTASWRHNRLYLKVEDLGAGTSAAAVDTSVDIPDDLDQFQQGGDCTVSTFLYAPIHLLEYYPDVRV